MTAEEWASSNCAQSMLSGLHQSQPGFLRTQLLPIYKFRIACCWKHKHLIPQDGLRNGLIGAEKWITGEIDNDELDRLNYYAEADAFFIDYAETPTEISELGTLINGIVELRGMPFEEARSLLKNAAYFAEGSMTYPRFDSLPWVRNFLRSDFLCHDLLREFVKPNF
jgi:hypothetical protein